MLLHFEVANALLYIPAKVAIFHAFELHFIYLSNLQVTMKPNPHPERPDRLRAIMGGLEAAGKLHRK